MSGSRLDEQRQQLSAAYQDKQKPVAEQVKAFDDLLETFTDGTREEVMDKYINYGLTKIDYTTHESPDVFVLHLTAPDGSQRHIPLKGRKVMSE